MTTTKVCIHQGREFTIEQSLGGNAAELVGWAYRGTHETSNILSED